MRTPFWFLPRAWLIVAAGAVGFLGWTNWVRIQRIDHISNLPVESVPVDSASPTGYAGGVRMLVVPEQNSASYQWIVQTQLMLTSGGAWRLRHVDYDNAPFGREVNNPSPYRWWLGLVAWTDHVFTRAPLGQAVERAALFAEPVLHLLLIFSVGAFVARKFGPWSASAVVVGLATFYPFAGEFIPGQPDGNALAYACALGSLLPLLAAFSPASGAASPASNTKSPRSARRCVIAAGIAGGFGMWIDATTQTPILLGIVVGAILASLVIRTPASQPVLARSMPSLWRVWGTSGATTASVAYLLEYFPSHLDVGALRLQVNHPLYALAWLGGGELLARGTEWIHGIPRHRSRRNRLLGLLAVLAVVAIPGTMALRHSYGFLAPGISSTRLSKLPDGVVANHIVDWIARDGIGPILTTTLLPLWILFVAAWLLYRARSRPALRASLALALGPVSLALVFAVFRLQWWSLLDCTLLGGLAVLVVAMGANGPGRNGRAVATAALLIVSVAGAWRLWPGSARQAGEITLSESEAQGLLERDLAHWIAAQSGPGGAIVLAPPALTASLTYYGNARGLVTPYWENYDGFAAAVRIAGATSLAEGETSMRRRQVTHILIPSWDSHLTEYAQLATAQLETTLIGLLQRWLPPRWLRPVPYRMPAMAGFEGRTVAIFTLVDLQEDVTALSHLAEYFIETGRLDFAERVAQALADKYAGDAGALVARAQVAVALQDAATFREILKLMVEGLGRGDDGNLPWDRRVNLALVLAQGNRPELARAQLKRCLTEIDAPLLRSLTTLTDFRFLALAKALNENIADPSLRDLALKLLPPELRDRVR